MIVSRSCLFFVLLIPVLAFLLTPSPGYGVPDMIPFAKQWMPTSGTLTLRAAAIAPVSKDLRNERDCLTTVLKEAGVTLDPKAAPVRLSLAPVALPELTSRSRYLITAQAYRIIIVPDGVLIEGATPAAVFHGIQTLAQMLSAPRPPAECVLPCGIIKDWPDLPLRMIMIDAARQNENFTYYRRVIDFAARWKINAIMCHLTDDQTAALHHPDYPELMHPRAWKPEEIAGLVAYAKERHIDLIPEIESLGHSRMFLRHPDFREILHQTKDAPDESWMGTDVAGFTNVLCPASDKAMEYLDKMYARAAESFPHPLLHVGCDEVDMTSCDRCDAKFGAIGKTEWFRNHILRCREIAAKHGRRIALWGDMLLKDPAILDGLPREGVEIYEWNYRHDVPPDALDFFLSKGFEVVACPALVCAPHMLFPDDHNYQNIERYTRFARERDCLGVNTTIWVPQRYMSDVLWPGIAYAAAHAWGGSRLSGEPDPSFVLFFRDYFRIGDECPVNPRDAARAWRDFSGIMWHLKEFMTACWTSEDEIGAAQKLLKARREDVAEYRVRLKKTDTVLSLLAQRAVREREAAETMRRSALVLDVVLEHLEAAEDVGKAGAWNRERVAALDARCAEAIRWIEEDWDRNRYADDPNKDGIHVVNQHLLHRFRQMRRFHESLRQDEGQGR